MTRSKKFALSMIIGGALGNILDRIPDGYVTDFLHLKVNEFSFFIFNPADALISIGAITLISLELFKQDYVNKS
jgi:signal peptidase II